MEFNNLFTSLLIRINKFQDENNYFVYSFSYFSVISNLHLSLLNKERAKLKLGLLTYSNCLMEAAQDQSSYMLSKKNLTYSNPHGDLFSIARFYGQKKVNNVYENIGYAYEDDKDIIEEFMKGPQKENILNKKVTQVGVGVAQTKNGPLYWTQFFTDGTCSKYNYIA
ncbi:hypothetical protein PPL_04253 [Heterostelium album PN500]|uniref:SCP domain-containing protein n=1 Tax=Heterostelium pallidum (strain ATCC 26659 / Pp 5 / PN500) TaxID=670386 RepID=D3B721_HETP5|nr:hypothetical protein PPL_04253 [Heterostelium album PN500]EFA82564.1 hypothetical protein PPL_04253 [Heterostelium album PN500]|eukprot:XP_020434681.1 hypothetical protein PPL_04253 [Heterostelium album PN500]